MGDGRARSESCRLGCGKGALLTLRKATSKIDMLLSRFLTKPFMRFQVAIFGLRNQTRGSGTKRGRSDGKRKNSKIPKISQRTVARKNTTGSAVILNHQTRKKLPVQNLSVENDHDVAETHPTLTEGTNRIKDHKVTVTFCLLHENSQLPQISTLG